VSNTFHGRDVFAPIAAWLAKGAQASAMGDEITEYKKFAMPKPKPGRRNFEGRSAARRQFWNIVTNFRSEDLPADALENGAVQLASWQPGGQQIGGHVRQRRSGRSVCLRWFERIRGDWHQSRQRIEKFGDWPRHPGDADDWIGASEEHSQEWLCPRKNQRWHRVNYFTSDDFPRQRLGTVASACANNQRREQQDGRHAGQSANDKKMP